MLVKFKKLRDDAIIPTRADSGSAGWDLYVPKLVAPYLLQAGETRLFKLGFATEFPGFVYMESPGPFRYVNSHTLGLQIEIRPRSGLAAKHSLNVLNSPGTIDSSYRLEWGIILHNHGVNDIDILGGDRIAQAIMTPYFEMDFKELEEKEELTETERKGGFGSTGR